MQQHQCFSFLRTLALAACGFLPVVASAQESGPDAAGTMTARLLEQISSLYADVAALVGDNPAQAVEWAEQDIENLGDWEYRIVLVAERDDTALEAALNALGNERWEVYWVMTAEGGTRYFLKRPALSYLNRVPLSTVLRLLGGGQAN